MNLSIDFKSFFSHLAITDLSQLLIFAYLSIVLLFIVIHQTYLYKKAQNKEVRNASKYTNTSSSIALTFILTGPFITLALGYVYGYDSDIFAYWIIFFLSLLALFDALYWKRVNALMSKLANTIHSVSKLYKVHEFDTYDPGELPQAPSEEEKYSYIKRNNTLILIFSIVSFTAIQISMFNFLLKNELLWPIFFYFILTIIYFLDSFLVNITSKDFNLGMHKKIVKKWKSELHETVDIFLPTAGEPIDVLRNTWDGIREVKRNYHGNITVYCLDDAAREEVKQLAAMYGFRYEVRPNRGWYKKAGNLRHGFTISSGKFIVIFDADFRPRGDILQEMLPYFYENKTVGLVQSPQYFDVRPSQNWLQRGAGAVQELFYRVSQVSRQNHNASICVGSNAIYRRAALADIGGTALIEHSEDVHTGFNMRMHGWTIQYLPIVLAKGLCPGDMKAFFKQQYRWCMGSMTLLTSGKFWRTDVSFSARLSYFSGFLYYIHTAVSSFFVPIIPLAILTMYQDQVTLENYLLILPSIIFVQIIYPLWHRATYGIEAWSTRIVYGWAHLFAITDAITQNKMQWQATGAKIKQDFRYLNFRFLQIVFNFIPSIIWIYLSAEQIFLNGKIIFIPILLSGVYYYLMSSKVTFYIQAGNPTLNVRKPDFFSRLVPVGSFSYTTALLAIAMGVVLYANNLNSAYISPIATTNASVIAQNTADTKVEQEKRIIIDEGAYVEFANAQDTIETLVGRMLNTYSAESGDILTKEERANVQSQIAERFLNRRLTVGEEIRIPRKDMRVYVRNSRAALANN